MRRTFAAWIILAAGLAVVLSTTPTEPYRVDTARFHAHLCNREYPDSMRTRRLFMLSAVLLLGGVVLYSVLVKGTANVNVGIPLTACQVGFNMNATGGLAILAFVLALIGAILLLVSLALGVMDEADALRAKRTRPAA